MQVPPNRTVTRITDLLGWVLCDVIEDGCVSSVGDHSSPVGWLARGGGGKHKVLAVKIQPEQHTSTVQQG